MSTSLNLPDELLREVASHAARKGSDIDQTVAALLRIGLDSTATATGGFDADMLSRRRTLTEKFVSGELGVELAGYEEARAVDRRKAAERAEAWRE